MDSFSYGSIIVDNYGIRKRALPLVGKGFRINWDELTSWSASHILLPVTDTGKDEPISNLLELSGPAGSETIDRRAAGDQLDALVAYLRLKCPEKEARTHAEETAETVERQ